MHVAVVVFVFVLFFNALRHLRQTHTPDVKKKIIIILLWFTRDKKGKTVTTSREESDSSSSSSSSESTERLAVFSNDVSNYKLAWTSRLSFPVVRFIILRILHRGSLFLLSLLLTKAVPRSVYWINFFRKIRVCLIMTYSRLPLIRNFKGNRKKFELSGGRVVEGKII